MTGCLWTPLKGALWSLQSKLSLLPIFAATPRMTLSVASLPSNSAATVKEFWGMFRQWHAWGEGVCVCQRRSRAYSCVHLYVNFILISAVMQFDDLQRFILQSCLSSVSLSSLMSQLFSRTPWNTSHLVFDVWSVFSHSWPPTTLWSNVLSATMDSQVTSGVRYTSSVIFKDNSPISNITASESEWMKKTICMKL